MIHPIGEFCPPDPHDVGLEGRDWSLRELERCYQLRGQKGYDIFYYPIWFLCIGRHLEADWLTVLPAPWEQLQGRQSEASGLKRSELEYYIRPLYLLNPVSEVDLRASVELYLERSSHRRNPKSVPLESRLLHPGYLSRICILTTPETDKIGLTLQFAKDVQVHSYRKGVWRIWAPYLQVDGTGKRQEWLLVDNEVDKWIGERLAGDCKKVLARRLREGRGELYAQYAYKRQDELDYVLSDPAQILGLPAALIPFIQHNDGARALMGAKMLRQALPLLEPESPLVRTGFEAKAIEYSSLLQSFLRSPLTGQLRYLSTDHIHIEADNQRKVCRTLEPKPIGDAAHTALRLCCKFRGGKRVQEGEQIFEGPGVKDGKLALGKNFLVAYLPFKGYNFEDGIVISESAARKLASPNLYVVHREHVQLLQSSDLKRRWGEDLIPAGAWVRGGDLLAVVEHQEELWRGGYLVQSADTGDLAKVARMLKQQLDLKKSGWASGETRREEVRAPLELTKGVVVHSEYVQNQLLIWIYEEKIAQVGDKLAGRHGNKGVITRILPDREMPYFEIVNGEKRELHRIEVILNPLGVLSRMNLGQLLETHWGWVLHERPDLRDQYQEIGRPFGDVQSQELQRLLQETGLDERGKVELYDGRTNEKFHQKVVVGYQHLMKLAQLADQRWQVRGRRGPRSLMTEQPARGKKRCGGQRLGEMEVWALLAHGAVYTVAEILTAKADDLEGAKKLEFLKPLPARGSAETLRALRYLLWGLLLDLRLPQPSGPSANSQHARIHLIRPAGIRKQSQGEVRQSLLGDNIEDGLYSWRIFGASRAERRSRCGHIELAEPILHPFFKDEIIEYLHKKRGSEKLTKKRLENYWRCKAMDEAGRTGTQALLSLLQNFGFDKKLWEPYLIEALPVIPPAYRPRPRTWERLGVQAAKQELWRAYQDVVWANELYRQLKEFDLSKFLQKLAKLPRRTRRSEQQEKFSFIEQWIKSQLESDRSLRQVAQQQNAAKNIVKAMLQRAYRSLHGAVVWLFTLLKRQIEGKDGLLRRGLLGKRIDFSARAIIVPAPDLHLDECYVPWEIMLTLLEDEVQKQLRARKQKRRRVKKSKGKIDLIKQAREGNLKAIAQVKKALAKLIAHKKIKVLLNRQPTLHRYGILSFTPKIWDERVIGIPPLICGYYNADFDGDQMALYLPFSKEAQEEAERFDPLKHLFSAASGDLLLHLTQDIVLGIYYLSVADQNGQVEAWKENQRQRLAKLLGIQASQMHEADKKKLRSWVTDFIVQNSNNPKKVRQALYELSQLGFDAATRSGISFSFFDLQPLVMSTREKRDWLKKLDDPKAKQLAQELQAYLQQKMAQAHEPQNAVALMYLSGARGSWEQILQLVGLKGRPKDELGDFLLGREGTPQDPLASLLKAHQKKLAPPILANLYEGLSPFQYAMAAHATRRTMADKKINVAKGGHITRELVESAYGIRILAGDCVRRLSKQSGSRASIQLARRGIPIPADKALGRYLAEDRVPYKAGKLIQDITALNSGYVRVRSPLTCALDPNWVCQKCYGWDPATKEPPQPGTYVGIIAAQSIGERGTQLAMQTFHTAGLTKALDLEEAAELLLGKDECFTLEKFWSRIYGEGSIYRGLDPKHFETIFRPRMLKDGSAWRLKSAAKAAEDVERRGFLAVASHYGFLDPLCRAAKEKLKDPLRDPKSGVLLASLSLLQGKEIGR